MASIQIQQGQTLGGIAKEHGTDIATLQNLNPSITDTNKIFFGQMLNVPDASPAATLPPVQPPTQPVTQTFGAPRPPAQPTQTFGQPQAPKQPQTPPPALVSPAPVPLPTPAPVPPQIAAQEAQKQVDELKNKATAIQASVKALPQDQLTDQGVVGKAIQEATSGVDEAKVSIVPEAQDYINQGFVNLTNLLTKYNELSSGVSLVDTYKGLLESQGVTADKLQLVNLQNVINGTKDDIKLELENAGVPVTQSGIEYLASIRNSKLTQQAQNLQNIINDKEDFIDKMVSLTGEDRKQVENRINTQFNIQKQQLDLAQGMIKMRQDSELAYQNFIEKQKDNARVRVEAMYETGALAGASNERLKQLSQESGGVYTLEDLKLMRQHADEDDQLKKAEIISQINARSVASGIDQDALVGYQNQYASTGSLTGVPKNLVGEVTSGAKAIPRQTGTIVDSITGVKSSAINDTLQGGYANLYSVINLAKELKELDKQRWGGLVAGTVGKVLGSSDQAAFISTGDQIVDLLARARSGAALTATEEQRYSSLIPGRFNNPLGFGTDSQVKIDNLIRNLSNDLENKLKANGLSIYGFSKVGSGDEEYLVGDIVVSSDGRTGRILPDGSVAIIQ